MIKWKDKPSDSWREGLEEKKERFTPTIDSSEIFDTLLHTDWAGGRLDNYHATEPWQDHPATERQLEILDKRCYEYPKNITKGQCAHLIPLSTPKQAKVLKSRGLWNPSLTIQEATEMISEIAASEGWKSR